LNDYARRFKLISAVGRSMPQELDLNQILQRIVDAAQLATRAEVGFLLLKDEGAQETNILANQGCTVDIGTDLSLESGDERLAAVCHEGATVRVHSKSGPSIKLQNGDMVSAVCQVPVQVQGSICGLLTVDRRNKGNAFGQLDEQTLTILAHYASLALVRERMA
jgi:transcriptional regulator with GAF, ATPase, and Fis domain